MASGIIKPLTTEVSLTTTPTTLGNNHLVRITHVALANAAHVITCKKADTTTKWTLTIAGSSGSTIVEKDVTDTLESDAVDASVKAVPIAYRH